MLTDCKECFHAPSSLLGFYMFLWNQQAYHQNNRSIRFINVQINAKRERVVFTSNQNDSFIVWLIVE